MKLIRNYHTTQQLHFTQVPLGVLTMREKTMINLPGVSIAKVVIHHSGVM